MNDWMNVAGANGSVPGPMRASARPLPFSERVLQTAGSWIGNISEHSEWYALSVSVNYVSEGAMFVICRSSSLTSEVPPQRCLKCNVPHRHKTSPKHIILGHSMQ